MSGKQIKWRKEKEGAEKLTTGFYPLLVIFFANYLS